MADPRWRTPFDQLVHHRAARPRQEARYIIATGTDITERKRLERAVLEVSSSEQRRIGQDLHDGLGQHLTGIAFLSKTLEQKLADADSPGDIVRDRT